MTKNHTNYSKKRVQSSLNPQGKSEDTSDHEPKSQLEQRAKKRNTKI